MTLFLPSWKLEPKATTYFTPLIIGRAQYPQISWPVLAGLFLGEEATGAGAGAGAASTAEPQLLREKKNKEQTTEYAEKRRRVIVNDGHEKIVHEGEKSLMKESMTKGSRKEGDSSMYT